MKKQSENIVILLITIFLIAIFSLSSNNDDKNNNIKDSYKNNATSINQVQTTIHSENNYAKKTYKVNGDEYINYIKSTIKNIIVTNDLYQLRMISVSYPYIKVYIDYFNPIDKTIFNNKNMEIANNIYNKFKENNYEDVPIYQYKYNIISLEFYSQEINCKSVCAQNDFIQIDVLEIENKSTLQEYLKSR